MSPVTCHLTATLCSFTYSESPRRFGDAAAGGSYLGILRKNLFNQKSPSTSNRNEHQGGNKRISQLIN